ncbi:flagellar hook-associated protein FlgK, partial [Candidatus Desantisbacteria bacterium]|nr:flagellar hook-associated protein FlgK [Candidatus Desantisbacteria bacterium]
MLNIFGSFEAAKRAMQANLNSIITTSHNISNANTPGYSKQQVIMDEASPNRIPQGWIGNGVEVKEIRRMYDHYTNLRLWNETGELNEWEIKKSTLGELENILDESTGGGLNDVLGKFWNGWQSLINNPADSASRVNVREIGNVVSNKFNSLISSFNDLAKNLDDNLIGKIEKINQLSGEIALLNKQAGEMSATGSPNDILDQIDLKIDELSGIADVKAERNDNGTVKVTLANVTLVEGVNNMLIGNRNIQNSIYNEAYWVDAGTTVDFQSGEIKGIVEARDDVIDSYKDKIDSLASELITQINTIHRQGMGMDGSIKIKGANAFTGTFTAGGSFSLNGTNININAGDSLNDLAANINSETLNTGVTASIEDDKLVLEPDITNPQLIKIAADPDDIMLDLGVISNFFNGTGASDIAVDPVILNDTNKIAASATGAPGDNANALNIYALKKSLLMDSGSSTFDDFYAGMIGSLGVESQEANNYTESQNLVVEQIKTHKQSIVGVSMNEELS